ncbi:hypothetical protein DV735_g2343, partial [Chaetothyriales sp. CBS 134920]
MAEAAAADVDYSLNNPDTLTKYKTAGGISQKVLAVVSGWCVAGETILHICEKGDKLLEEEIAKVYKGKKITKGIATPTTVSPSSYVTPFTPLVSDPADATIALKAGELVKIQLGAQIDGFGAIVGTTIVVPEEKGKQAPITGREADALLATHYANELLLRVLLPPGLLASGSEEEKQKAAAEKRPTQSKIISLVEKVAKAYDVQVVQHTTSWQFERNDIEGKKKIILSPSDTTKGEGHGEVGDVWGVEVGMSLGSGKVKDLDKRSTLLRRTALTYGLKRPSSRQILSEIVKKFGTFPFSLRQLDDEKAGKVGVVECVRAGVLREYKPSAEADGSPVTRLFTTIAITKNGVTRLAAPPALDVSKIKSDKKIEDEEILEILARPLAGAAMSTRSLRNRPSTRQSSPDVVKNGHDTAPAVAARLEEDGSRDNAEDWIEPPVRKLPPSYQDHKGLERVGVLELQQPLGELPSAKLLQRLKLHLPRPSPRPASQMVDEAVTPSVESDKLELASPVDAVPPVELAPVDLPTPRQQQQPQQQHQQPQQQNLQQQPQHQGHPQVQQPQSPVISSPPRGRPAKRDIAEMRRSLNPPEELPVKSTAASPSAPTIVQRPVSIQEHLRQDRVQGYVERAINEAEQKGDNGLVPGLRRIRERAIHQRELWAVLDAIAHSQPTEEQLGIFKKFIKRGMKRHRRSAQTPNSVSLAVDQELREPDAAAQQRSNTPEALPRDKQPPLPDSSTPFTSSFRSRPSTPHRHLDNRLDHHLDHAASDPLRPTSSGSRRLRMSAKEKRHGRPKSVDHSPRVSQSRSNSVSSSLSSAKSIPEEFAPLAIANAAGADEQPVSNGLARQANPTVSRTRSTAIQTAPSTALLPPARHPFAGFPEAGKPGARKAKGRKELGYDPVEVEQRRERYLANSYLEYNNHVYPELNDRHHPSERDYYSPSSTTESQVPPPVVHANPVPLSLGQQLRTGIDALDGGLLPEGASRKRRFDQISDDDSSETASSGPPPPPPPMLSASAAVLSSRSTTPRAAKTQALKQPRKSARVMFSPNKLKNGGIGSRISRTAPLREDATVDGVDSDAESMHHRCLIPPLDATKEVDGEWFCPVCVSKRSGHQTQVAGLLGKVIQRVDGLIPKAFNLPYHIRDYFEGIRTGESGEYEEYGQPATQQIPKMNRAGFIEEPNYKELRDSKGNLITCYLCGLTSNGRDIIPCSYCPARWHLDCCNPPLAIPPRRRAGDKAGVTWRCPLHIEHDLARIGSQDDAAAAGDLGRQPRPRRPKNARPVDVDLTRGFRNNGVIDVELESDVELPSIKDVDMQGQVFRLQEKGIRLDFIDRVKRSWYEDQVYPELIGRPKRLKQKLYQPSDPVTRHEPTSVVVTHKDPDFYTGSQALAVVETAKANAALRYKTFAEQQTILGLVEMSKKKLDFSGDSVADLTNQLIIDAPPEVGKSVQQTEKDRLLRLQDLINRRLKMLEHVDVPMEANTEEATQPTTPPAADRSVVAHTQTYQVTLPEQTVIDLTTDQANLDGTKDSGHSDSGWNSVENRLGGGSFTETVNCGDGAVVSGQTATPPAEPTSPEKMDLSLAMPRTVQSLSPPLQEMDLSVQSMSETAPMFEPTIGALTGRDQQMQDAVPGVKIMSRPKFKGKKTKPKVKKGSRILKQSQTVTSRWRWRWIDPETKT